MASSSPVRLIATNGPPSPLRVWTARAISSFPVPVSPVISTGLRDRATDSRYKKIVRIRDDVVMMLLNTDSSSSVPSER